jgi:hypothetical protein
MQHFFDNIDSIAKLVDDGAWEDADVAIRAHDAQVREAFASSQMQNEPEWREVLIRQRQLSLKFASMHSDVAQCIDDLRKSRAAAQRYLATHA